MSRDTASDMHLFKEGRAPFLEFLRNLTPQALILSIAMLSGHNLQWSCCHVENTWETILSAVFFMIWVAAVWANSSLFVQRYLISVERIDRVSKRLGQRKVTGFRHLQMLLTYAWRYRRVVLELVFVGAVLEIGMTAVVIFGVTNSQALAKAING